MSADREQSKLIQRGTSRVAPGRIQGTQNRWDTQCSCYVPARHCRSPGYKAKEIHYQPPDKSLPEGTQPVSTEVNEGKGQSLKVWRSFEAVHVCGLVTSWAGRSTTLGKGRYHAVFWTL